jgi:hypothetical protein
VAFWYQKPEQKRSSEDFWIAEEIPWAVLGPLGLDQPLPKDPDAGEHPAEVVLNKPEKVTIAWRPVVMTDGFLDLCHHYRHFLSRVAGTGYIPGEGRYCCVTHVFAPEARTVNWRLGHDDRLTLRINESRPLMLKGSDGFQASVVPVRLQAGWNRVAVTLENRENVNWRWAGFCLALEGGEAEHARLRWVSQPY